jgi:hypothetical protein
MGNMMKLMGRIWIFLGMLPLAAVITSSIYIHVYTSSRITEFDSTLKSIDEHIRILKGKMWQDGTSDESRSTITRTIGRDNEDARKTKDDKETAEAELKELVTAIPYRVTYSVAWLLLGTTVGVVLLNQAKAPAVKHSDD